eukprot:scaffold14223_cov146-Isochrysis_galbana.AAC.1
MGPPPPPGTACFHRLSPCQVHQCGGGFSIGRQGLHRPLNTSRVDFFFFMGGCGGTARGDL